MYQGETIYLRCVHQDGSITFHEDGSIWLGFYTKRVDVASYSLMSHDDWAIAKQQYEAVTDNMNDDEFKAFNQQAMEGK